MVLWAVVPLVAQQSPTKSPPVLPPEYRAAMESALRNRNYSEVKKIIEDAASKSEKPGVLWAFLGQTAFVTKHYEDAIQAFTAARKSGELREEERMTLATAYRFTKRAHEARAEWEKLIADYPKSAVYTYRLAELETKNLQYDSAIRWLKKTIDLAPEGLNAFASLGLVYETIGKFEEALEVYKRALEINRKSEKQSPQPPLNLGALLERMGKVEEAEPYLREAARTPNAQAEYRLGLVLEKLEKPDEALQHYRKAIQISATYPEAYLALGKLLTRRGQEKEAQEALAKFEELRKKDPARK